MDATGLLKKPPKPLKHLSVRTLTDPTLGWIAENARFARIEKAKGTESGTTVKSVRVSPVSVGDRILLIEKATPTKPGYDPATAPCASFAISARVLHDTETRIPRVGAGTPLAVIHTVRAPDKNYAKSVADPTRQEVRVVHIPSGEIVFRTSSAGQRS